MDFQPMSPYALRCKHGLWAIIPAADFGQKRGHTTSSRPLSLGLLAVLSLMQPGVPQGHIAGSCRCPEPPAA